MRTSLRPADLLDLTAWPKGMRVIMRRERPHQGARLRFEDVGGYRLTAFATNTKAGQLADLEVRHRLRARCQGTASAVPRTPDLTTSPCRGSLRTVSGA